MRRENLILGIVFLVLLGLAFAWQPFMDWKKNLGQPDNFLSEISFSEITGIEITKGGETITLERQGEKWKIAETKDFFVSDRDEIFTSYLEDALVADLELVSTNPEKKPDFETGENGAKVTLKKDGEDLSSFVVGRITSDFAGSYISREGEDETYKIAANLGHSFNRDVETWYDLNIFSSDKEAVDKIRFQYSDSEFSLEKQEDGWVGVSPYRFNVDEDKLDEIVTLMSGLNASDIPEQKFEGTGLENHSIIVELSGEELNNTIMIGDSNEEGDYFAKRADSDNIYLISPEDKEKLETSIFELR